MTETCASAPRHRRLPMGTLFFLYRQSLLDRLGEVERYIGGVVVDVGCNDKPYARFFDHRCRRWVGVDRLRYNGARTRADIAGDALRLPLASNACDTVLCTQVLDDLPTPEVALAEFFRVLRPGGHVVISASQYNALHDEPDDYFRFTCHGLRFLATRAGFRVVVVLPVGGAAALVGRVLCTHIPGLNRRNSASRALTALLETGFYHADRWLHRPRDPLGWLLVGERV